MLYGIFIRLFWCIIGMFIGITITCCLQMSKKGEIYEKEQEKNRRATEPK